MVLRISLFAILPCCCRYSSADSLSSLAFLWPVWSSSPLFLTHYSKELEVRHLSTMLLLFWAEVSIKTTSTFPISAIPRHFQRCAWSCLPFLPLAFLIVVIFAVGCFLSCSNRTPSPYLVFPSILITPLFLSRSFFLRIPFCTCT